jgi:hypothetical protein
MTMCTAVTKVRQEQFFRKLQVHAMDIETCYNLSAKVTPTTVNLSPHSFRNPGQHHAKSHRDS